MVQGAVFSGITITEGFDRPLREVVKSGDRVRVDPSRRVVEVLVRV
jgi:predicted aconitase with swiveling domain